MKSELKNAKCTWPRYIVCLGYSTHVSHTYNIVEYYFVVQYNIVESVLSLTI